MKTNKKNGYTLIELLAVMFILLAVGAIISSILASVLRSSNKSTNTDIVRANGNTAIAQMSRMIAYAQKFEGVSCDGINFYSDCTSQPDPTSDCTFSASGLAKYNYLQIKSFDGGETTFVCDNSRIASQSSTGIVDYLVDPTLYADCSLNYFNCTQTSAAAPAKIDIFLDLKATPSANFSESQAEIPFETSVVIKNSGSR
jgi:type II secretory pathway pseudopilin PulG